MFFSFIRIYKRHYCCREQNLVKVTTINGLNQQIKRLDQKRLLKSDLWLCLSQIELYGV